VVLSQSYRGIVGQGLADLAGSWTWRIDACLYNNLGTKSPPHAPSDTPSPVVRSVSCFGKAVDIFVVRCDLTGCASLSSCIPDGRLKGENKCTTIRKDQQIYEYARRYTVHTYQVEREPKGEYSKPDAATAARPSILDWNDFSGSQRLSRANIHAHHSHHLGYKKESTDRRLPRAS
jgi:hypothetical protein